MTLDLDQLPDRDLEPAELQELVAEIATHPEQWNAQVAFSDEERHFVSLHRDGHVDIWLLCWTPVNDTGWHDHDISSGAVAVAAGSLIEHNLSIARGSVSRLIEAGESVSFGPDHIHRMVGESAGSVSIHAYSPPLWRMGQYSISEAGVLKRLSLSYADELRPVDDPAELASV